MLNFFSQKRVKSAFRQETKKFFIKIIALFILATLGIVIVSARIFENVYFTAQLLLKKIHAACGCVNIPIFYNQPWLFTFLWVLAFLIFLGLLIVLYRVVKLFWKTHSFICFHLKNKQSQVSLRVLVIAEKCGVENKIVEINNIQPVVFCFGLWRPKLCISSGLVERLSDNELTAVILHEKSHLEAGEPLKLLLVKIISLVLFFIPGIKILSEKYLAFSELAADELATDGFNDKVPLASALSKIISWEQKRVLSRLFALSFFSAVTAERVQRLLDDNYAPSVNWLNKKVCAGMFVGILLFVSANIFFSKNQFQNTFIPSQGNMACVVELKDNQASKNFSCWSDYSQENCKTEPVKASYNLC